MLEQKFLKLEHVSRFFLEDFEDESLHMCMYSIKSGGIMLTWEFFLNTVLSLSEIICG